LPLPCCLRITSSFDNDRNNNNHTFYPLAIDTGGAIEHVQEIGRRATLITGEPRESIILLQQLSVALQRGNAVAFLNSLHLIPIGRRCSHTLLKTLFTRIHGSIETNKT